MLCIRRLSLEFAICLLSFLSTGRLGDGESLGGDGLEGRDYLSIRSRLMIVITRSVFEINTSQQAVRTRFFTCLVVLMVGLVIRILSVAEGKIPYLLRQHW